MLFPLGETGWGHINLIDQQNDWYLHLLNLLQEVHVLLRILHHIRHVEQDISILQGRLRESEHRLLKLVVRLQYAWRVGEDNLHLGGIHDAHDAMSRGLGLKGCNRNTLTNQLVHERTFTYVGISNDIDESCFVHQLFTFHSSLFISHFRCMPTLSRMLHVQILHRTR